LAQTITTRSMAITNGTCVSFCKQPKAHYLAISRESRSRRYVVAYTVVLRVHRCRYLATSRESKAHFGLPGYAPGTIAVNVTWMERGFNACQTNRSTYPSIFNHFLVIQPENSKVLHFSTFCAFFWSPLGTPLGQSR